VEAEAHIELLRNELAELRLTIDKVAPLLCGQFRRLGERTCVQAFKGQTEQLNVNSKDMPSVEAAVTAKLQQDPSIDHIIALDASIALTTVQSRKTAGSKAVIDTFDTNAELVSAIKNGDIGWAIDQQPFLQGYLAIDSLWLYINNRNTIGGGTAVLTGPAFIDSTNIDSIAKYAANGTR
jgi:simple sugar transport system substrate-binding protein